MGTAPRRAAGRRAAGVTVFHTRAWHAWRAAPRRAGAMLALRAGLWSAGLMALVAWWATGRLNLLEMLRDDAGALLAVGVLAAGLPALFHWNRVASTLQVRPEGLEQRVLLGRTRVRWDQVRRAFIEWHGRAPVVHLRYGRNALHTIDTREWVPPEQCADAVLLALATFNIQGRALEWEPGDPWEWVGSVAWSVWGVAVVFAFLLHWWQVALPPEAWVGYTAAAVASVSLALAVQQRPQWGGPRSRAMWWGTLTGVWCAFLLNQGPTWLLVPVILGAPVLSLGIVLALSRPAAPDGAAAAADGASAPHSP